MKKRLNFFSSCSLCLLLVCFFTACSAPNTTSKVFLPNPWTNCQNDLTKEETLAGFAFPVVLSNYTVRAMKDMIEVRYPLDENRYLTVRKGGKIFAQTDISGDYHTYPIIEKIALDKQVNITLRRDEKSIYVLFFSAKGHAYSIHCPKGMAKKEALGAYRVIAEAENLPRSLSLQQ